MRIRTRDIHKPPDEDIEQREGTIAIFGEGREEIHVQVDNFGRIRISSPHVSIKLLPVAANSVFVKVDVG